ncbi:hypothetical protein [Neisseria sp.]
MFSSIPTNQNAAFTHIPPPVRQYETARFLPVPTRITRRFRLTGAMHGKKYKSEQTITGSDNNKFKK